MWVEGSIPDCEFSIRGVAYYSYVRDLKRSRVRRRPETLSQARVYQARVLFDPDRNGKTNPLLLQNLRQGIRRGGMPRAQRAYIRFVCGAHGEIYWSSKASGKIYIFTNSVPKG